MKYLIYRTLVSFYNFLEVAILVYCIGSWFVTPGSRLYDLWRKLGYFLEPLFLPAKKLIMFIASLLKIRYVAIDFSPWLTMILMNYLFNFIIRILY